MEFSYIALSAIVMGKDVYDWAPLEKVLEFKRRGWRVMPWVTVLSFDIGFAAVAAHALPRTTGLRDRLIDRFGRAPYLAGYSALSIALLAWLISAAWRAPYVPLWHPGAATAAVPLIAMLPACLLIAGAALRPNPLSVSFVGGDTDPGNPGILALTRHPMLWGFFLWSASHAVANGDLVSTIMFGGLAAFSILGMRILEKRALQRMAPESWEPATASAAGPLPKRLRRAASPRTALEAFAGTVFYGLSLWAHPVLFGVDPLALLR